MCESSHKLEKVHVWSRRIGYVTLEDEQCLLRMFTTNIFQQNDENEYRKNSDKLDIT